IEDAQVAHLEKQLNDLLKRQGKLTTESKELRKIKKRLMDEIVPAVDELSQGNAKDVKRLADKIAENKRLIEESNEKLEDYQEELSLLPARIEEMNRSLMLATMHFAYIQLQQNTDHILDIADWVSQVRLELKEKLVEKQQLEILNHNMYTYMHNLFGAEVLNLFDLKYNPAEQYPKKKEA
ncbi:MAG: hypothetical protein LBM60_06875, partial [Clostridium sp.]|nr:hypothetical protein [Clostridium sp.]